MPTAVFDSLLFIPVLPLLSAAILALFGARMSRPVVNVFALGSVGAAFLVTCAAVWGFYRAGMPLEATFWSWIEIGRYQIDLTLGLDQLAAALLLVVTGVGFLIHVYSVEYMSHDPGYSKFFAYLNFFIFAMSVLVLGRSLPVMFIGWEGVGLASYLLIGFWYTDAAKASAGKKAFITNRVGDFGFLIGTLVMFSLFGTGDFIAMREAVDGVTGDTVLRSGLFSGWTVTQVLTFGCLMLFVGAAGKSAQFPLYVWLPDAMAGPTPVSALIHAATMVTAGVYMCCRVGYLFDLAPAAQQVIAYVGGFTALFAASMGLAQNDIKKVLAYSTVSQLGYMFMAVGVGAYAAAMFHVVTHAFFKACLFLGSGAVIHAMHEEQDMRKMGGLARKLPVVFWTFAISTLALAGIPPLSGFFSKDAILAFSFEHGVGLWLMGFLGAGLTALYMTRLVCLTFFGELRARDASGHALHLHPPAWWMKGPLVVLAFFAVIAGFWNLPHILHGVVPDGALLAFDHFLAPAVGEAHLHLGVAEEVVLILASVAVAAAGIGVGFWLYGRGPSQLVERWVRAGVGHAAHVVVAGKYYVDEIIGIVVIKPLGTLSRVLAYLVDPWLIDAVLARLPSAAVSASGKVFSRFQTGNVQSYAVVMVLAVAVVILWSLG
jgi:NADH-quinone oxidoreductase subunit L